MQTNRQILIATVNKWTVNQRRCRVSPKINHSNVQSIETLFDVLLPGWERNHHQWDKIRATVVDRLINF